jgi:hypothetical protein
MPRNEYKRRCVYPGCRAWARRDLAEPYCAAHARLVLDYPPAGTVPAEFQAPAAPKAARGGQPGNRNRLFHGFYRRTLDEKEARDLGDFDEYDDSLHDDLGAEILVCRVALRRTLAMFGSGTTLGQNPRPLDQQEHARLASIAFQGARTIARLMAVQHQLGRRDHLWEQAMDTALDELSAEWGIEL